MAKGSTEDRFRVIAEKTAAAWAQRVLRNAADHSVEEETAAAVIVELRSTLPTLESDLEVQRRLARDLGADMLYALEAAYVDEPEDDDGEPLSREAALERALLYLARGWKREGERIWLHDCTEGIAVTAKLPDTSAVE